MTVGCCNLFTAYRKRVVFCLELVKPTGWRNGRLVAICSPPTGWRLGRLVPICLPRIVGVASGWKSDWRWMRSDPTALPAWAFRRGATGL